MNSSSKDSKRGIFFTLDVVFALLILVSLFSVFMLLSVETISTENMHQLLTFQAEDAVSVLAKTTLGEVKYLPIVKKMEREGALVQIDDDYSIMEVAGALWATNDTVNMVYASTLIKEVLGPSMPKNLNWRVTIDGDVAYQTSSMSNARLMSTVSNRMVSGYMKGKPHLGYAARAFLSNIKGKSESSYVFFGGFTGQGNVTGVMRDIPADANITGLYIEARAGSPFWLYINDIQCQLISINESDTGYLSWDLSTSPDCTGLVTPGGTNVFQMDFTSENITLRYFGGGYIRATYSTATMKPIMPTKMRYYLSGIRGIINIFDSFFVPGNITSITGWLNLSSNYTTYMKIGNATIFERELNLGTAFEEYMLSSSDIEVNLTDNSLSFNAVSNRTVPVRFGTPEATFVFGGKDSDVVLVNDVSGSMALCMDQDDGFCDSCGASGSWCDHGDGTESCGYEGSFFYDNGTILCSSRLASANCTLPNNEKKIETLKGAAKNFLDILFSAGDNRVGIVDYSSEKEGNVVLPDIGVSDVKVYPDKVRPKIPYNYTFVVNITNYGFAPVLQPFTVALLFPYVPEEVVPLMNFSVDPPLNPGQTITLNRTVELNISTVDMGYIIAWADCGGAHGPGFGLAPVPGLCPPEADGFGVIEEYSPLYDGNYTWLNMLSEPRINNFNVTTWEMGVDLVSSIVMMNSTPHNTSQSISNDPWVRHPVICTSETRDPYNQTMFVYFNVTNRGKLNVTDSFNITLMRWNEKCSQWETVGIKNNTGSYGPTQCIHLSGVFYCLSDGNPMTIMSYHDWTLNPLDDEEVMYADATFLWNFTWDIENYTSTLGAACDDFDTSDPLNVQYYNNTLFELIVAVDLEENVPEGIESNNNASWDIYLQRPDITIQYSLGIEPPARCEYTGIYSRTCGNSPYCNFCGIQASDLTQTQSMMNATISYYGNCPVPEEFHVAFWTKDDWCIDGTSSTYACQTPVSYNYSFTQDCSWEYRGDCIVPASDSMYSYKCENIIPSGLPLYVYIKNMTNYGGTPFGVPPLDSCTDTYSSCIIKARSVGLRQIGARADNDWVVGCGWGGCFDQRKSETDFGSAVGEVREYNNWKYSNITTNLKPDLSSSMQCNLPAEEYRYGYGPVECTVCFSNASRGAVWNYNLERKVTLSNALYHCTAYSPICWPNAQKINVSLYANCSACSTVPSPSGCSDDFGMMGGSNCWTGNCHCLTGGGSATLDWGPFSKTFTEDYSFCSVADPSQKISETNELNNHNQFTFSKKPSDIFPDNWKIQNVPFYQIPGVTYAANGTVYTCYGAGTKTLWPNTWRYALVGYVNVSADGPCSFVENFTIGIGNAGGGNKTAYLYTFEPYTGYANSESVLVYKEAFTNVSKQLADNNVNPGDRTYFYVFWDGKAIDGMEDYEKYYNDDSISLYTVVNEPEGAWGGSYYHYPAETSYVNNWFTSDTFKINYEAPDLLIEEMNISEVDDVYTINLSILNNDTSLGQCNTSLQSSFKVGLYENATSVPVLVNETTITNIDALGTRSVQFIYHPPEFRHMKVVVDYDAEIFESNEWNNQESFDVTVSGGADAPEAEHNTDVLLSGTTTRGTSLLLSGATPKPKGRSVSLDLPGPIIKCTVAASPDDATGPFTSTVRITSCTVVPLPFFCSIDCGMGGLGLLIDCGMSASCAYPAVAVDTLYTVTGGCGAASCTDRVTVRAPGVPTCTGMTATPNSGNPLNGVTVEATYTNAEGFTVDMQCNTTGAPVQQAVVAGGKASITCNYGTVPATHNPSSNYTGTTCSTTATVLDLSSAYCTVTPGPSSGVVPLYSTISVDFYNYPTSGSATICCNGTSNCTDSPISLDFASTTCLYTTAGIYTPTANYSALTCSNTVNAMANQWDGYVCPTPGDDHLWVNAPAYRNFPMYDDSIIARLDLANTTEKGPLYDHIENHTETLHRTCICCGLLEAVDMLANDTLRQTLYRPGSIVLMSDGKPTDGCLQLQSKFPGAVLTGDPIQDTIEAACYAYNTKNLTVYTIAFGSLANATLMNDTAVCGGGESYTANNSNELVQAYQVIADRILNFSYSSQSIEITGEGFVDSILDPNSYLEFTYEPYIQEFGWNDITIYLESPEFSGCTGEFNISDAIEVYDAIATSYSGLYWTSKLDANGISSYDMMDFCPSCSSYKELGDPFNMGFDPALLKLTEENELIYTLGNIPGDSVEACGEHNKLIYKAKFAAAVPFSDVLPDAKGMPVEVFYDLDSDGVADDSVVIPMGSGLVGIPYDDINLPQPRTIDYLYANEVGTNSLAYSFTQLLNELNYFTTGGETGYAGSSTNPIDIYLDPEKVVFRSSSIYEVPYMWGPVDVSVNIWVE
ncbi:MAG: CARDB domain-containing protein [Candidatus Micrarchaeota archaeon]